MRHSRKKGPAPVGVISKVFQILEAIQGAPSGLPLKSICELTRINKSTAHRFLKHLERDGYLMHTEYGVYLIGPRLAQMAARVNHRATLQAAAQPILWELWKSTRETVNLAVLDQATVLYVDVLESPHEFRLSSRVGTRRQLHATALGKALSAYLPDEQIEDILGAITFQPLTPKTIMNLVQLRQELEKIRRQGYAVDDEETTLGARCVSAPILGARQHAIAAISVSGPVTRIAPSQVAVIAQAVIKAAAEISAAMGFPRSEPAASIPHREASSVSS
jgi:DNA-binding IclR family transcriptional regulator